VGFPFVGKVEDSHNQPTSRAMCDIVQIRLNHAYLGKMLDLREYGSV
jgi:hypothetical protein